jgi:hypothetical protein
MKFMDLQPASPQRRCLARIENARALFFVIFGPFVVDLPISHLRLNFLVLQWVPLHNHAVN